MNARWSLTVVLAIVAAAPSSAQEVWKFQWQKGQVLSYRVKHVTKVAEVVDGKATETTADLDILKRWRVTDVDAKGIATLELSLASMRNEQTRPNGEKLLFDSEDDAKCTPGLREQLMKFVRTTLATVRVDAAGKVLEVTKGFGTRYEAEPPFVLVLPGTGVKAGEAWQRLYNVTLEPPHGTGEKYQAEQSYECKKVEGGKATLALTTQLKTQPESVQGRLPLLPKEVAGEIVFDLQAGRLVSARLAIDRTIADHQGKGSSYRFESRYSEVLSVD